MTARMRSGNWWLMVAGIFLMLAGTAPPWAIGALLVLIARDNWRRQVWGRADADGGAARDER